MSAHGWLATAIFAIATIVCADAVWAAVVLEPGASCMNSSCHTDNATVGNNHLMTGQGKSCGICHTAADPAKHEFQFTASGGELCTRCHAPLLNAEYKHVPAALGLCTTCHKIHRAEHAKQLQSAPETLCKTCHVQIAPPDAKTLHEPASQGRCADCHDPHSSNSTKQLHSPVPELCFGCHDQQQPHDDGTLLPAVKPLFDDATLNKHPAFSRGQCLLCHEPHDSENYRLQKDPYPESLYARFSAETYFCVNCHGLKTFTEARTLTETGFRNGNLNLHHRHVNKAKGRSCRACHHHHASDRDALVTGEVSFGDRYIEIADFSKTESGGSCSPSCHKAMRYDRIQPVDNRLLVSERIGTDATPEELQRDPSPIDGAAVYEKRCVGCHGIGAAGKVGPEILGATAERINSALATVPMMWVLSSLMSAEIDAVAAFLSSGQIFSFQSTDVDGNTLFATICAGCHGMDAKGAFAPEIRGVSSEKIKQAIAKVPEMKVLAALSTSEIQAVADALPKRSDPIPPPVPAPTKPGELDGEQLFATRCAACHGVDATGGLNGLAPSIVGIATVVKIKEAIGRVALMAPLASLHDDEIGALGTFLTGSADLTAQTVAKPDIELGKSIFTARCAACHGNDAMGGLSGMAPEINGASAERIRQAVSEVPMMAPLASVTKEETEAIAAFLQ